MIKVFSGVDNCVYCLFVLCVQVMCVVIDILAHYVLTLKIVLLNTVSFHFRVFDPLKYLQDLKCSDDC